MRQIKTDAEKYVAILREAVKAKKRRKAEADAKAEESLNEQ